MNNEFRRNLRDAALLATMALPAGAGPAATASVDTGPRTARASFEQRIEAVLKVPAIPVGVLGDGITATLSIESSATAGFSTIDVLRSSVLTGAGGVGVAAAEVRVSLPSDVKRYLRGKVVLGTGAGSGSALTAEFALVA